MDGDPVESIVNRAEWPNGRTALITTGELAGMYALVAPEVQGRWIVYVSEASDEPSQENSERYPENWGLTGSSQCRV